MTTDKPDLPECTCAVKDMPFGRCCKAQGHSLPTPVAVVGDVFGLFWAGSGPIAPMAEMHGIKAGDGLYASSQVRQLLAQQEATHKAAMVEERRRALEDAAKLCDEEREQWESPYPRNAAGNCRDAIRAFMEGKP